MGEANHSQQGNHFALSSALAGILKLLRYSSNFIPNRDMIGPLVLPEWNRDLYAVYTRKQWHSISTNYMVNLSTALNPWFCLVLVPVLMLWMLTWRNLSEYTQTSICKTMKHYCQPYCTLKVAFTQTKTAHFDFWCQFYLICWFGVRGQIDRGTQ